LSGFSRLTPKINPHVAIKHGFKDTGEEHGQSKAAEQKIATDTEITETKLRENVLRGIEKPQIEALEYKENELDVMTVKIDQKIAKLSEATKRANGAQNAKALLAAKKRMKKLKKKRRKVLKQRLTAHKTLLRMKGVKPEKESLLAFGDLHEATAEKSSAE